MIDVRCDCSSKVSNSDVEGHADATFVLPCEVVAQPLSHINMRMNMSDSSAYQATTPGNPAYAPATQRNVPKYFAPEGAFDMLIPKPIAQEVSDARMNGNRIWIRSDQVAKIRSTIAMTCKMSAE
jgi:hypothetical protein